MHSLLLCAVQDLIIFPGGQCLGKRQGIDQLESGIEFSSEEAEVYAVLPASPGVVYCYNCVAANEQGAKFCMECGTEL